MTPSWHSLYLSCDDRQAVVETLKQTLRQYRYELFDPFGLLPGRAYPQAVRLFVAPGEAGWVRVIGEPDLRQLGALSRLGVCLSLGLEGDEALIDVYAQGEQADPLKALAPHLQPDKTPDHLQGALSQAFPSDPAKQDGLPLDALPDEVQSMARNVSMKHAQKMFNRLAGKLMKGGDEEAARGLLSGHAPDWNSAGGQRIRALMACLTVPGSWREPDFVTLRDAYQLHTRRRRNPNAMLYPGDTEAMAKVPNALDYVPVYGGKNT